MLARLPRPLPQQSELCSYTKRVSELNGNRKMSLGCKSVLGFFVFLVHILNRFCYNVDMYIFKNRTHYAQGQVTQTVPTTWEQTVVNREVEWKLGMSGLSYRVIGTRVNHQGAIVIPEHAQVVLYEGVKNNAYKPDPELLQALADAWAASILLPDGEAYSGHNAATEGPSSPQVTTCSFGTYPYFQN